MEVLQGCRAHFYAIRHIFPNTCDYSLHIDLYRKNTEKGTDMKEVFQEYGGVIVTIIAILSLIAVITAVIGTGEDGIIGTAFSDLIESFLQQAGVSLGGET